MYTRQCATGESHHEQACGRPGILLPRLLLGGVAGRRARCGTHPFLCHLQRRHVERAIENQRHSLHIQSHATEHTLLMARDQGLNMQAWAAHFPETLASTLCQPRRPTERGSACPGALAPLDFNSPPCHTDTHTCSWASDSGACCHWGRRRFHLPICNGRELHAWATARESTSSSKVLREAPLPVQQPSPHQHARTPPQCPPAAGHLER